MARFSPIMGAVKQFAERGGMVFGICNGFQILTEAGLLPGALVRNAGLRYVCRDVHLRTERQDTPFTARIKPGTVLRIPIGHGEGCYFAPDAVLQEIEKKPWWCSATAMSRERSRPPAIRNGSLRHRGVTRVERAGTDAAPDRCAEEVRQRRRPEDV
jgi:phosphoribosylformylglycinamidine synthase